MRHRRSTDTTDLDPPSARSVLIRLDDYYGRQHWKSHGDPIAELVATILSQHTSDRNSRRAFADLRTRFPTWQAVVDASDDEVADTIRSGGLADSKAPRIRGALKYVMSEFPAGDLGTLRSLPTPQARALLTAIPGVGPKTASCVLLFSLGVATIPVDTHVHRVARRLGLIGDRVSAENAHDILEEALGDGVDDNYSFHLNAITHGRGTCVARTPRCHKCPLLDICTYGLRQTRVPVTARG